MAFNPFLHAIVLVPVTMVLSAILTLLSLPLQYGESRRLNRPFRGADSTLIFSSYVTWIALHGSFVPYFLLASVSEVDSWLLRLAGAALLLVGGFACGAIWTSASNVKGLWIAGVAAGALSLLFSYRDPVEAAFGVLWLLSGWIPVSHDPTVSLIFALAIWPVLAFLVVGYGILRGKPRSAPANPL